MERLITGQAGDVFMRAMENIQDEKDMQVIVLMRHADGRLRTVTNVDCAIQRIGILQTKLFYEQGKITRIVGKG